MNFSKYDLVKLSVEDYTVVQELEIKGNVKYYKFYFKDNNNLISYISFNIIDDDSAYIIDITNSNGYEYMSDNFKKIYLDNGYKKGTEIKGFGNIAFIYVLEFIKNEYCDISVIVVNSLKDNEKKVGKLIDGVVKETIGLVDRVTGAPENYYCTIYLDKKNN